MPTSLERIEPALGAEVELWGHNECLLSGVVCPQCSQWGSGRAYPRIRWATLSTLGSEVVNFLGKEPWEIHGTPPPMSMTEFRTVQARLAPVLGPDKPLEPGTSFGPLSGEFRGTVHDFTWPSPWSLLLKQSVFEQIRGEGFMLEGATADLTFKVLRDDEWVLHSGPGEPLVEIDFSPTARLASDSFERCEICGRTIKVVDRIVARSSVNPLMPIQQVYEEDSMFLVSEAFAKYIQQKRFSGVNVIEQESI